MATSRWPQNRDFQEATDPVASSPGSRNFSFPSTYAPRSRISYGESTAEIQRPTATHQRSRSVSARPDSWYDSSLEFDLGEQWTLSPSAVTSYHREGRQPESPSLFSGKAPRRIRRATSRTRRQSSMSIPSEKTISEEAPGFPFPQVYDDGENQQWNTGMFPSPPPARTAIPSYRRRENSPQPTYFLSASPPVKSAIRIGTTSSALSSAATTATVSSPDISIDSSLTPPASSPSTPATTPPSSPLAKESQTTTADTNTNSIPGREVQRSFLPELAPPTLESSPGSLAATLVAFPPSLPFHLPTRVSRVSQHHPPQKPHRLKSETPTHSSYHQYRPGPRLQSQYQDGTQLQRSPVAERYPPRLGLRLKPKIDNHVLRRGDIHIYTALALRSTKEYDRYPWFLQPSEEGMLKAIVLRMGHGL